MSTCSAHIGLKAVKVLRSKRISGLEDGRAAKAPATGHTADRSLPSFKPLERVIPAQRESIRHIEDRWPVVVARVKRGRISRASSFELERVYEKSMNPREKRPLKSKKMEL